MSRRTSQEVRALFSESNRLRPARIPPPPLAIALRVARRFDSPDKAALGRDQDDVPAGEEFRVVCQSTLVLVP